MPEIRFHGRGGQGAVVASRVLAEAAFLAGSHVQSFPSFGLERRGAPVIAFTRIESGPISDHSQIYAPSAVVVLDASLLPIVDVAEGLVPGGLVLVNSGKTPAELSARIRRSADARIAAVNAGAIAAGLGLGSRAQPIVNTAILGALARVSGYVTLENVATAIQKNVPVKRDANVEACRQAYAQVTL